jgi:hypothetical protein
MSDWTCRKSLHDICLCNLTTRMKTAFLCLISNPRPSTENITSESSLAVLFCVATMLWLEISGSKEPDIYFSSKLNEPYPFMQYSPKAGVYRC